MSCNCSTKPAVIAANGEYSIAKVNGAWNADRIIGWEISDDSFVSISLTSRTESAPEAGIVSWPGGFRARIGGGPEKTYLTINEFLGDLLAADKADADVFRDDEFFRLLVLSTQLDAPTSNLSREFFGT